MSIADEIIVLDSFSTDKTQEIAKQYNAKFYQHPFDGHIQQKNRAITYASNNFILSLDADEMLSPQLRQLIAKEKEIGTQDGYTMNRLNFYEGKPIETCGLHPDKNLDYGMPLKGNGKGETRTICLFWHRIPLFLISTQTYSTTLGQQKQPF